MDLRQHLRLRFEVRDYVSPAPHKVIAAAPGGTIGGWLNDANYRFGGYGAPVAARY